MPQVYGKVLTTIPSAAAEGAQLQTRVSRYGDVHTISVISPADAQAIEGSHFIAMGTTPNTGIATPILSTLSSETAGPALVLYNASTGGNVKNLVIDYIRLYNTVVPASSTDAQVQFGIDTGNRYSSGGTGLTIANSNMNSSIASNATCTFGSITATAATGSRRWVEWLQYKTAIITVKDVYNFNFGQLGVSAQTSFANNSATPSTYHYGYGPIVIGPGQSFLMYMFYASNATTGASWAPVISWYER